MAGEVKVVNNLSYGDYCDAGKPYGKQGYPKWIHEEYNKRIAELEAEKVRLEQALEIKKRQHKHITDSLFILSIERKELAAKMELVRKFIGSFTKYHEEMCSTFLDDAPEDECDCAKGAATKLLARLATDTDHCPSCGEYLHDEMGHMCPPTRQPDCSETDEVAEYLRREEHDRAIRMDTAKLAVVIAKEEEILFGPEDYNKAVKDVVAALERDFGLEG